MKMNQPKLTQLKLTELIINQKQASGKINQMNVFVVATRDIEQT